MVRQTSIARNNSCSFLWFRRRRHFQRHQEFIITIVNDHCILTFLSTSLRFNVCIGSVYAMKLLVINLFLGFHASENIIRLADVFKALSRCRSDWLET